jgi:lipopolysaccharide export system protein LptA
MKRVTFLAIVILMLMLPAFEASQGAEKKPFLFGKADQREKRGLGQPLRITSQQLEADHKNRVILFRGNVVAKQGEMTIYSDVTQVYYEQKEEGHEVREIVATGNVKFQEGDRLATGQKVVFTNSDQKIVLTGQPKLWQGKDMVSGEKITVLLEEEKSLVESGPDRKVEVIFYPKGEPRAGREKP